MDSNIITWFFRIGYVLYLFVTMYRLLSIDIKLHTSYITAVPIHCLNISVQFMICFTEILSFLSGHLALPPMIL